MLMKDKKRLDPNDVESPRRLKPGKWRQKPGVPPPTEAIFTKEQILQIFEVFHEFDRKDNDKVYVKEVPYIMRFMEYNPTEAEIAAIPDKYDPGKAGVIDFRVFLDILADQEMKDKDPDDIIIQAFKVFDREGYGRVQTYDVKNALCNFGEKLTFAEANVFVQAVDPKRLGSFNYEDFYNLVTKKKSKKEKKKGKKKKKKKK